MIEWLWPLAFLLVPTPILVRWLIKASRKKQPALTVPTLDGFNELSTEESFSATLSTMKLIILWLAWILVIHFIEGNFLNPKIMGTAAHIHPALIVFALVTGEYIAGIAGALLAVPIFSILQTLFVFLKAMVEEFEPLETSNS